MQAVRECRAAVAVGKSVLCAAERPDSMVGMMDAPEASMAMETE